MNVKRRFSPLQHLLVAAVLVLGFPAAYGQHTIVGKDGRTSQGQILGAADGKLQVKIGAGTMSVPLASIERVEMPPPPEVETALKAYRERNYPKALVETKAVVDKDPGLPVDWARQAAAMLGDLYVALEKYPEAEAAYKAFQQAYPGQGSIQADVGMARIAVARKNMAEAKAKLEPIAAEAVKQKNLFDGPVLAYSQAFYLLGRIKESENDLPGALQDYLRTVTLFFHDPAAVTLAQQAADELRKKHPDVVVP